MSDAVPKEIDFADEVTDVIDLPLRPPATEAPAVVHQVAPRSDDTQPYRFHPTTVKLRLP